MDGEGNQKIGFLMSNLNNIKMQSELYQLLLMKLVLTEGMRPRGIINEELETIKQCNLESI